MPTFVSIQSLELFELNKNFLISQTVLLCLCIQEHVSVAKGMIIVYEAMCLDCWCYRLYNWNLDIYLARRGVFL